MADVDDRIPCKVCGRKFNPDALTRHQGVCKTVAQKPRKVFDSSKQRVIQGELSLKQIKQAQKKDVAPPPNHWRERHKDFLSAVRGSKGVSRALESGGPLPPPPPPSLNPDYIQCPYCSRRFNEKAASRHISFCKEQSMRLPKGKADPVSKAKQTTRLNYQPPKLKSKTAAQPTTPTGAGSGRGAGAGSRGPAPRGRAGVAAGQRYAQEDEFSLAGQGVFSGQSNSDFVDMPSSQRSNSYSQAYSTQHHPNLHQKNKSPLLRNVSRPTDDDSYLDSDRDSSSDHLRNFPDHFNKRYKNNPIPSPSRDHHITSYSRTKPPSNFQYLDNIDMQDPDDDDMYLYSKESSSVTLYGNSHPAKPSSTPRGRGRGQSKIQSAPKKKVLLSYCQECGAKYPMAEAKFCCECGQRRP